MHNKKAQIADSMTWIIATLIIIVILTISIFVVLPFGKEKKLKLLRTSDILATKSLIGYLQTDNFYEKISGIDKKDSGLDEETGPLAEKIFKEFYRVTYEFMWFGTDLIYNEYFGNKFIKGPEIRKSHPSQKHFLIIEEINLNKNIKLILKLS